MNNIDEVFDKLISQEDGIHYKVNRLTVNEINEIPDFLVYESDLNDENYNFKGNRFRPNKTEERLRIETDPIFTFEIKTILILISMRGTTLGSETKRFSSSKRIIRELLKFSKHLNSRGYESFHELGDLPKLKFNDIVSSYVSYRQSKGQSTVGVVKDSLATLLELNFLNHSFSKEIIESNTKKEREKADTVNRLKHSLVPPMIQKKLISEYSIFFNNYKKDIIRFVTLGKKVNTEFESYALKNENIKQSLSKIISRRLNESEAKEYSKLRKKVEIITPYTFNLLVSLTGLRVSEAKAARNNSHKFKKESGSVKYFIESTLRKYTSEDVVLDWVSCKLVYDAMRLLSKVNDVLYERMNIIIKHYPLKVTEGYLIEYKAAIESNHLFVFNYFSHQGNLWIPRPSNPINAETSGKAVTTISLDLIKVFVTEYDIKFLDKYKCNYKSVNVNSGLRGQKYKVGDVFRVTSHMLRHTFAWFIIANKLGDIHHISQQLKHTNEMVTFVYAQRGFEAIDELKSIIGRFDTLLTEEAMTEIVESAIKGEISGGGGRRLKNYVKRLNQGQSEIIFSTDHQEHIESIQELIAFTTRNSDGILGLPHGYCTSGSSCKMHSVAVPQSCVNCDTYFVTKKHLPFWIATKNSAERGIDRIVNSGAADRYQAFLSVLNRTLDAANKAISDIAGTETQETSHG
jgi:integrase